MVMDGGGGGGGRGSRRVETKKVKETHTHMKSCLLVEGKRDLFI